jgi:hypothetical protein
VAAMPDGFAAVWEECVGPANYTTSEAGCVTTRPQRLVVRVYDAQGVAAHPEAVVPVRSASAARPRMAADAQGKFMVVWQDKNQTGSQYEIRSLAFDKKGVAGGEPVKVNKNERDDQLHTAVAVRSVGGGKSQWVITWDDDSDGNIFTQVLARGGHF